MNYEEKPGNKYFVTFEVYMYTINVGIRTSYPYIEFGQSMVNRTVVFRNWV